jgi:segregation and condensation protein A
VEYKITIDQFEGPLDLLLHLIKQSEIDIYDISIEKVTKQYLDYIRAMEELNLSIASEYLVMAADLIEMKSRLLLPKKEEENDEYEEDPREALINRLLDYKRYKEITGEFKKLEEDRQQIYTKIPSNFKEYTDENVKIINNNEIGISDLLDAFQKFLDRKRLNQPLNTKITAKEITVQERSRDIRNILKLKREVPFTELFDIMSKDYIVVTFLAILEMAKKQELIIKQDHNFDDIILSLRGSDVSE